MAELTHDYIIKLVNKLGILNINTQIFIPILFMLLIGFQSSFQTQELVIVDRFALNEDNTFEEAISKYMYEELSNYFEVNRSTRQTYYNGDLYSTNDILSTLNEINQMELLNESTSAKIET